MPESDGSLGPTDIAILSARVDVARVGASRVGFYPEDVEGAGTSEPGGVFPAHYSVDPADRGPDLRS